MSDTTLMEESAYIEEIFEQDSLNSIYLSLSITENTNVDLLAEKRLLLDCIKNCFDDNFKKIETKKLEENVDLLNNSFVKLLLFCKEQKNYKKVGYIFIEYCDYFDLDCHIVYSVFHDKLKLLIDKTCKSLVGEQTFQKMKIQKNGGLHIPTLFDIVKGK